MPGLVRNSLVLLENGHIKDATINIEKPARLPGYEKYQAAKYDGNKQTMIPLLRLKSIQFELSLRKLHQGGYTARDNSGCPGDVDIGRSCHEIGSL
jgi:hypothetical protein